MTKSSFLHRIINAFANHAGRNAFCIQGQYFTYSKLAASVSGIQQILATDFAGEQRIGVLINDNIETYAAILAILLTGKTYIPIHPGHPADRIGQIIEQSGLNVIFSTKEQHGYPNAANVNIKAIPGGSGDITLPAGDISQQNAYILFTSGSTGIPKGTPISYHNLNSFIEAFDQLGYDISEQDRFLQMFDLTFDLSVISYLIPLCTGACVYTIPEHGVKFTNIYGILEEHKITFALMVPSILSYLRPYFSEIDLPHLRYSLFCGEALLKEVVTEWAACAPNAIIENVYGPTEATIFCLTYRVNASADIPGINGIVTIGKPMAGMEAIVVNDDNMPLAPGEKGELCLYGNQVTAGYLDEAKSMEAFFTLNSKRYYRTGDIAFIDENDNFMYCGRTDHQVKIQGFRVELSEVEHHVRASMKGINAIALATNTTNGLNQVDVVIECPQMDTDEIIADLKLRLPSYMMPSNIHFIHPFPLNVNGKTDRKALKSMIV